MVLSLWFRNLRSRPMTRDKSNTLLLLVSCAAVILPHLFHLPAWLTPACAAILLWRGWITFRGLRMPPRWLLLTLSLSAVAAVVLSFPHFLGREVGVAILTVLLTLKLLEMHARRDLFVVLFLCFFLSLTQFFYSQSIGTAAYALLTMTLILTTQLSFQFTGAIPSFGWRLKHGAMILAMAAPLTLVLFLLFPRIQGPLWGLPSASMESRIGLSEDMSPGNISDLADSDEIAFRVRFKDRLPPKEELYWRGIVLGLFDGTTWTSLPPSGNTNAKVFLNLRGTETRYELTLEPHGKRWLFALDMPRMLPYIAGNTPLLTTELQMLSSRVINERVRYDLDSHTDYLLQANETLPMQGRWLQLPDRSNPRTIAFARQLRQQHPNPAAAIDAVLRMFREERFRYTLKPPPLGRDHVDDFLFSTRAGFCEHYSSAFVVLARAMNIPARVVTGYQGGELNPDDGYVVVRQSDAHAWAEVWLEKRGWVRIDPTGAVSPERVERNLRSAIPRQFLGGLIKMDGNNKGFFGKLQRVRQSWEAVGNSWNQWVLNYTPQKQQDFFKSIGLGSLDWRSLSLVMVVSCIFAVAIVVLPLMLRQQKRDPVQAVYDKVCKHLARLGFPRETHEGPRQYAGRLLSDASALPPKKKEALSRFLQLYETVRYGTPDAVPPSYLSQLKRLSSACR
jgi:protein-glutamine gamma-glutamyltransferase